MKVVPLLFALIFPAIIFAKDVSPPNINQEVNVKDNVSDVDMISDNDNEQLEINVAGYKIKLKGFFSAAGSVSDAKDVMSLVPPLTDVVTPIYSGISNKVGFESDSLAGLQLNAPVTDDAEVVLQIVARGRPTDISVNKYELNATWAYLNYNFNDHFSIKAGRILVPVYMLSQYVDVAYAYPWIKPPQEIYGGIPFPSSNGVIGSFLVDLNDALQLELEPFFVANSVDVELSSTNITVDLTNQVGLAANISNDWFKVTALYTKGNLAFNKGNPIELNPLSAVGGGQSLLLPALKISASYLSFGLHAEKNNILVLAEYALRQNPGSYLPDSQSWYVLGGVQIGKFMPWVTFAEVKNLNKDRINTLPVTTIPLNLQEVMSRELISEQRSIAAGIRYDFADNMAFKLSVTHITPLNGGTGLFNVIPMQKSVNIYNAGINLVF